MRKKLILIILAILFLFGYAYCAAPLMALSAIHYYGTITLWTAFIFTLEEIYWDFLNKNNNQN